MSMWDKLVQKDQQWFLYLNGLGTETWDGFWLFMTDKWGSIPLYLLLLLLSLKFFGLKKTGVLLLFIALLITSTDQLANFFKYGVQRFRPCHEEQVFSMMRLVKSSCGGKFGYFSAHAASSMALATFFALLLRKKSVLFSWVLVLWALLVGYSRIYIGVHYPGDVLTGFVIGAFFGWLFAKLYIFTLLKIGL